MTSSRKAASAASLQTRVNSAPAEGWQQGREGEKEEEEEEEQKEEREMRKESMDEVFMAPGEK